MRFSDVVPRWRRAGVPGVRLLVLLAALAGLFAMHGLSDHGAAHPGTHPGAQTHHAAAPADAPITDAMSHGIATAGHVAGTVTEVVGDTAGVVGVAADGSGLESGHHAAMALCLAILAGAAVLTLRRLRTWPGLLVCSRGAAAGRRPPTRARAPDPPDLHVLSIQRC